MPVPSFFQRFFKGVLGPRPGAEAVSLSQADVEAVRVRARRRLIGMAVLVGAGVIGFPWLFETKPRPMAMDITVVQQGASAPAAATALATKPGVQAQVKSVSRPQAPAEAREEFVNDAPKEAPAKTAAAAAKSTESRVAEVKVGDKKPAEAKESKAPAPAKPVASAAAAKTGVAAADKDKAASAASVRYVVQIGAYSDVPSAHEVRMKAERAGLKTYTQVIGTDANKKIRVRLGPFEDKAAADKAMATLKKAGLPGGLLTL